MTLWPLRALFGGRDEDFHRSYLKAPLGAVHSPSAVLTWRPWKVTLVISSTGGKAFLTLYRADSGRTCLLYFLRRCSSLSCLWRAQKKGLSWGGLPQTMATLYSLEAKRMSILIRLLFLLPICFEIKLVENWNVFLSLSLCTSIQHALPPNFWDQMKANRLMRDSFVLDSSLEALPS